jgi:hypothetical protein
MSLVGAIGIYSVVVGQSGYTKRQNEPKGRHKARSGSLAIGLSTRVFFPHTASRVLDLDRIQRLTLKLVLS